MIWLMVPVLLCHVLDLLDGLDPRQFLILNIPRVVAESDVFS
jgi:hypothetical protein